MKSKGDILKEISLKVNFFSFSKFKKVLLVFDDYISIL
jgi:hypothetical protein